jgi:leader peptidase (prepilin peptidase)/N-methyltransferase
LDLFLLVFLLLASPFVGSFLALLAFRLPEREDVVAARSHCRSCGTVLRPADLLPIVSFVRLKGHCRTCGAPISFAYPLIELGAILIAIFSAIFASGWLLLVTCLLGWALLAAAAADLRVFILPNAITLPFIPAGLAVAHFMLGANLFTHVVGAIAGGSALWLIDFGYRRVRGRAGLGMGDVKLAAAAGAWLGWPYLPWLLVAATPIALAMALAMHVAGTKVTRTTPLPYGAPLAAAFFALWLVRIQMM